MVREFKNARRPGGTQPAQNNRRLAPAGLLVLIAVLTVFAGCNIDVLYPGGGSSVIEDDALLAVVYPDSSAEYAPGDLVAIEWTGQIQADTVSIDLYHYGQFEAQIAALTSNSGVFNWVIPPDFDAASEVTNEYQVAVRARAEDHSPGELYVQAFSESFTIVPLDSGGLSDVTVSQRIITITVIDNGQQIDGDTVSITLNSAPVATDHVLTEAPGTQFELVLAAGDNVLEILAVNEGSVSPNTAQLLISNVTSGEWDQQWRLSAGESGSLVITAP